MAGPWCCHRCYPQCFACERLARVASTSRSAGDWLSALADCNQAVSTEPGFAKALKRRADCLLTLGYCIEARPEQTCCLLDSECHGSIPGHAIAAVGALKSSLWATPGGKEPHIRDPTRSPQAEADYDAAAGAAATAAAAGEVAPEESETRPGGGLASE